MRLFLKALLFSTALLVAPRALAYEQCGMASFYHDYYEGKTTSSGTTFRQNSTQAAHPYARFGTKFRVRARGQTTTVVITDRGPFVGGRVIDLSKRSFSQLSSLGRGVIPVCLQRLN